MAEAALYCSKGDAALLEGGMLDCSKGRCCASGWNCRANVYGSDTMSLLRRKILTRRLTTCAVVKDGEAVRLDLQNEAGGPVSLEMSLEQAQSLVMTLPHLLSKAFQARAQNPKARFVFPTGRWAIETTAGAKCLLLTLTTTDGFEATYGFPISQCERMGSALMRLGETAPAQDVA